MLLQPNTAQPTISIPKSRTIVTRKQWKMNTKLITRIRHVVGKRPHALICACGLSISILTFGAVICPNLIISFFLVVLMRTPQIKFNYYIEMSEILGISNRIAMKKGCSSGNELIRIIVAYISMDLSPITTD